MALSVVILSPGSLRGVHVRQEVWSDRAMRTGVKIMVFCVLTLIWSSTWLMIKVGLAAAPPFTAAGLRFIIASLVVFAILALRRIPLPRTRAFLGLSLFLGICQMGGSYALVYWAEQHISSGLTAILFSTMPLMVALLARTFLGDPLTWRKLSGIFSGTAGVYVIFSNAASLGGTESIQGVAAALGAAFLASVTSVLIKKHMRHYNPFASLALPMALGGVFLMVLAWATERNVSITWNTAAVSSILYLAVVGSVAAFALYFWIIKHLDVTVLSYQTFIIPIIAGLLGWIFLGETITIRVVLGGILILAGIAIAIRPRSTSERLSRAGT